MFFKVILALGVVFLGSQPHLRAQDQSTALSWENCVLETKKNNPQLASSRAKLAQAAAVKNITRSAELPQLNASLNADTSKISGNNRKDSYDYGVNVQQLIFDAFKTSYDVGAAAQNVRAAAYDYAVVSSNVRLSLRQAFIDLLNAQESLKVSQDIAQRRKQELDSVNLRYQGGAENKGSLLKAQANWDEAQYDIRQAQRDIALSQRRLGLVMGWQEFKPMTVSYQDAQDNQNGQPDFEHMLDDVPFLKELAAQKEAARLGVKSARADFFPRIFANAGAGKTDSNWPPRPSDWSAGLSVSLPIFDGGLQQAQLAQARAAFGQAEADQRSGRDSILFTLANTWTQWQDAIDNVEVQGQFLAAAKERAKIAEVEYTAGLTSFNDWIIIEDALVSAQKAFLSAQTNAYLAQANWVQAKGETLDD